jgi:endonuclease YncB( thermonuclease family)
MNNLKIVKKLFLLIFFFIQISNLAFGEVLTGRVVGVADGDTITVLDKTNTQFKVRLAGIDAPEKKQAFGNASKKSLSDLVFGQQVDVDWHKQDRYGRLIGKVIINDTDANLEQIKRDMAWFYRKYQNELILDDRLEYLHAEEYARNNSAGLWFDNDLIAPWDFRKR